MESGWNVWVWLMGVVSRRWVWLVGEGGIYGCGCKEVYRFPHTTYPYSSCICSFLQQHPYFLFLFTLGAHARKEGYCSCPVCMCVFVRSFLPPRASRSRNIGTYVFTASRKKTFIIVIFAKNASFRTYSIICLPRIPLATPEPQNTDINGIHSTWA